MASTTTMRIASSGGRGLAGAATSALRRAQAQAQAQAGYATAAAAASPSPSQPTAGDFSVSSTSSGIKVATIDEGAPTSAITVALKAGSRYEALPGLSHVLKNFVFKGTNKRSALRLTRETELLGGVLSSTLTREHLFLTAEFMRGDEPYFAEILGDVLTQSKFSAHEYHEEVVPSVATEYEQAQQQPAVIALDMAHQLAFRRGLGNSLWASPYTEVDLLSAVAHARSAFSNTSGTAVLASGIDSGYLGELVGEFYTKSSSAASSQSPAAALTSSPQSKYYGGELRVPITAHGGSAKGSLLVAFEGGNQTQPEYAVLKALLGGESPLKWGNGTAPLSKLTPLVGGPLKSVSKAFNLHYSDAGLFGIYIEAATDKVQELASKSVQALRDVAEGKSSEEDVKRAISRAKFEAATALESRVARQELVGSQVLESSSVTSLADAFSKLDGVSASKVQEAAKAADRKSVV